MNESLNIIEAVDRVGCVMLVDGENIRIKQGERLPAYLLTLIKEHKVKILNVFAKDKEAVYAGFMVGISGKVYIKSINQRSRVYIEEIGNQWEAWRETYQEKKATAVSTKIIATGTFEDVLKRSNMYFDYMERKRKCIN